MIVEPDFLTHWKTQMLANELADKCAPLYVIALWAHCQQRKSDRFTHLAPNALKAICRYEGEASKLQSALERCGFIEVEGEATVVHGWAEANATLVANWRNGQKGGRPKKPIESQPITQTENGLTQTKPIGEEKRREEKIPPLIPPSEKPKVSDEEPPDLPARRDAPTPDQNWATFLATEWKFYFRGTAKTERDLELLVGFFDSVLARNFPPSEVLARIRDKTRPKTQPTWEFEKALKDRPAASRESPEEFSKRYAAERKAEQEKYGLKPGVKDNAV